MNNSIKISESFSNNEQRNQVINKISIEVDDDDDVNTMMKEEILIEQKGKFEF